MLFMPNVRENLGLEVAIAGFSYYGRLGARRTNEGIGFAEENKQKFLEWAGWAGLDISILVFLPYETTLFTFCKREEPLVPLKHSKKSRR
jgi:hypothetical protein